MSRDEKSSDEGVFRKKILQPGMSSWRTEDWVGFEASVKSSPEINEAKHWEKCGGQTSSLVSNTNFAKTNISEKQISKKYTAIQRSLSGIHRNGDWKRKS